MVHPGTSPPKSDWLAVSISDKISQIRAISFDGDMTLWDFDKVMRNSLAHALIELRARLPADKCSDLTVDRMIEIRNAVAEELKAKRASLEAIRLEAFRRTIEIAGCTDHKLAAQLNSIYLKHRFENIELYPDVLPMLDAIADQYALGLVSNGNSYFERCGLQGRFAFVILAQNVGVEKPDSAIFQYACREAGCTPEQLMHIGDSLATDVEGARRAGAVSVWLNRDRKPNHTGIWPDHEIHSLIELKKLLDREQHTA
jgi:FMN hydrolase / 5-amino-6-(5-phospho-D-ribitylamino)uracil phosphatase